MARVKSYLRVRESVWSALVKERNEPGYRSRTKFEKTPGSFINVPKIAIVREKGNQVNVYAGLWK